MDGDAQFDADLAAALAASVDDHQQAHVHSTLVLASSFAASRASIQRHDAALVRFPGVFRQFSAVFSDLPSVSG